jgi:hypothetical protein
MSGAAYAGGKLLPFVLPMIVKTAVGPAVLSLPLTELKKFNFAVARTLFRRRTGTVNPQPWHVAVEQGACSWHQKISNFAEA